MKSTLELVPVNIHFQILFDKDIILTLLEYRLFARSVLKLNTRTTTQYNCLRPINSEVMEAVIKRYEFHHECFTADLLICIANKWSKYLEFYGESFILSFQKPLIKSGRWKSFTYSRMECMSKYTLFHSFERIHYWVENVAALTISIAKNLFSFFEIGKTHVFLICTFPTFLSWILISSTVATNTERFSSNVSLRRYCAFGASNVR